ncbi:expressed unknown protein [Seminavis robusta]|uniref:Uncharacterized protein n=1 Tax=Seminavis robusta TaxID=568900 RepID=A0A9N8HM89_9STRA|nr:expressed unknown protein [Seminavis robusta]|eukprot:Sro888_g216400.1 n/a (1013) ;mRNA; f:11184-14222
MRRFRCCNRSGIDEVIGFQALEEGSTSNTSIYTPPNRAYGVRGAGRGGPEEQGRGNINETNNNRKSRSLRRFFIPAAASITGRKNFTNGDQHSPTARKEASLISVSQASSENTSSRHTPQSMALMLSCSTDIDVGSGNGESNDGTNDYTDPAPSDEYMHIKGPIDTDTCQIFRDNLLDNVKNTNPGPGNNLLLAQRSNSQSTSIVTNESRSTVEVDDPSITDILEALSDYDSSTHHRVRRKSVEETRQSLQALTRPSYDSGSDEEDSILATHRNGNKRLSQPAFQVPLAFWPKRNRTPTKPTNESDEPLLGDKDREADQNTVSTKDHTLTEGEESTVCVVEWESSDSSQKSDGNHKQIHHGNLIEWVNAPKSAGGKGDTRGALETIEPSNMLISTDSPILPEDPTSLERVESSSFYTPVSTNVVSSGGNSADSSRGASVDYDEAGEKRGVPADDDIASTNSTRMSYSRSMTIDNEDELCLQPQPTDFSWLSSSNNRIDVVPSPEFVIDQKGSLVGVEISSRSCERADRDGSREPVIEQVEHDPWRQQTVVQKNYGLETPQAIIRDDLAVAAPSLPLPPPTNHTPDRQARDRQALGNQLLDPSTSDISKLRSSWKTDPIAIIPLPFFSSSQPKDSEAIQTSSSRDSKEMALPPNDDNAFTSPPRMKSTAAGNDSALFWDDSEEGTKSERFQVHHTNELVAWPDSGKSPSLQSEFYPPVVGKHSSTKLERKLHNEKEVTSTNDYPSSGVVSVSPPLINYSKDSSGNAREPSTGGALQSKNGSSKFALFDRQQDALHLHKPLPVRATYHPVSLPVVMDGPQGPASLNYSYSVKAATTTTTSSASSLVSHCSSSSSVHDKFRQEDQLLMGQKSGQASEETAFEMRQTKQDSFDIDHHIPAAHSLRTASSAAEASLAWREPDDDIECAGIHQGRASFGVCSSESVTSSSIAGSDKRRSVQSYWEQRIANASPILPPHEEGNVSRSERKPTSVTPPARKGANVMLKIQALERQFYGDR